MNRLVLIFILLSFDTFANPGDDPDCMRISCVNCFIKNNVHGNLPMGCVLNKETQCYEQFGKCELKLFGMKCGWKQTPSLNNCLEGTGR